MSGLIFALAFLTGAALHTIFYRRQRFSSRPSVAIEQHLASVRTELTARNLPTESGYGEGYINGMLCAARIARRVEENRFAKGIERE